MENEDKKESEVVKSDKLEKEGHSASAEIKKVKVKFGFWQSVYFGFCFSLGVTLFFIFLLVVLTILGVSLTGIFMDSVTQSVEQSFEGFMF